MNRIRLLMLALGVLVALTGFVFWRVHFGEVEPPHVVAPPVTAPPVEAPPPAAVPDRALEVTGRVVGPDLLPLVGVDVVLGEETARVSDTGQFVLAKARRPRLLPLQILRGAELVSSWAAVIVGDAPEEGGPTPPEGALVEDEPSRAFSPRQPPRLRWTINHSPPAIAGGVSPWLLLREALVEEWGAGARISLRGETKLPDGAHIAASLYFDAERTIAAVEPLVKDGRFEAALYWPAEVNFYSGEFEVQVSYSSVHESPSVLESWSVARPEVDWENLEVPDARHRIFAGTREESIAEDQAASSYYSRQMDEALRLDLALKSTLIRPTDQRGVFRSARRPGGNNSKDATTWFRRDLLTAEGKLDEPRWRRFLDEEWRPAAQKLLEEHVVRTSEKYGRAASMLSALLSALLESSYGYSKFVVYPAFGLEPHPQDDYVDEERSADLVRLEKIIRSSFEGLERYRQLVR